MDINQHFEAFAESLRAEADRADFSHLTEAAVARGTHRPRAGWVRTRAAAVAAGLVFGLASFGGAAYAADGAAPGDTFYWLDRLGEAVGIGDGGAVERLAEVQALIDHGHAAQGIEHAADTLIGMSEGAVEAREALRAAADRIATLEEVGPPDGVVDLLAYLAENVGAVDGPTVAEIARQIGSHPGGPPDDVPGGPPVSPGGPPEEPPGEGPPDGTYGPPEGFEPPPSTTPSS